MDKWHFVKIIEEGDVEAVKKVVLFGDAPDVNDYRIIKGPSYLFWAAANGHASLCQYLIELGADINCNGQSPLAIAASNGEKAVVHLLLSHGAYLQEEYINSSMCYWTYKQVGNERAILTLISSRRTRAAVRKIPLELYVVLYSFLK